MHNNPPAASRAVQDATSRKVKGRPRTWRRVVLPPPPSTCYFHRPRRLEISVLVLRVGSRVIGSCKRELRSLEDPAWPATPRTHENERNEHRHTGMAIPLLPTTTRTASCIHQPAQRRGIRAQKGAVYGFGKCGRRVRPRGSRVLSLLAGRVVVDLQLGHRALQIFEQGVVVRRTARAHS